MRLRALEILFRHKLFLALPFIIVLPLTAALAIRPKTPQWQTSARVWVQQDSAIYSDARLGRAPAINQAALLTDFLRSRSFALSILQKTSLGPELRTQRQVDTALAHFESDWVSVKPVSNDFIAIVVTMPGRDLSYQTLQAIISDYRSTLEAQQQTLNDQALRLYGDSLQQAQNGLVQAQNDLSTYLANHPSLAGPGGTSNLPLTSRDPNLALLMQKLTNEQSNYESLRDHYRSVQSAGALSGTFVPFTFNVVDPPQRPTEPIELRRLELLKLPAIGFALALLLSAGIGAVLILSDRTIVGVFDLTEAFGVPVLGEMPELRVRRRPWRHGSPDLARLLLSYPARRAYHSANGRHQ